MADERQLYVARPEDVAALKALWTDARSGKSHLVRLQAPFGGGRRAVVAELLRDIRAEGGPEPLLWRVTCLDQENGLQWLIRMYGALTGMLSQQPALRGRVEAAINSQLPFQVKRVQSWYQLFVAAMKDTKADPATNQVQLRLPQDNPLIALVEVVVGIAAKIPVFLELQQPHVANSLLLAQFVEALVDEARNRGANVMVVLHDEPEGEVTQALYPMPLLDLFARRADLITTHAIAPWGAAEAEAHLASKGLTGNAARIAEIAGGRPGYVAELVEILEARGELAADLSEVSFSTLVPSAVDEGELSVPTEPAAEGERKHATVEDAPRVAFFAALLGQVFPSALVASLGGFDRQSVDDLLDAMGDLFEEVQYSEELSTWLYKFKRGSWRDGILERNNTEEGHDLARRVALFMERNLVPQSYGFLGKTARLYAEHGAGGRASLLRSVALTRDNPDCWGLAYDLIKYFDEITWPDPLLRTVYMNLLDRMVGGGAVDATEKIIDEAMAWAAAREDRDLTAWLLFSGSKLDTRRQDYFRARERANDAIKLYEAMDRKDLAAEVQNHLAAIELQDGNPNAALERIQTALETSATENEEGKKLVPPQILASAQYLRGMIARRGGQMDQAIELFKQANAVAGQVGLGPVAVDAGVALGEAFLASRQVEAARDVLRQILPATRALGAPPRERSASELLAQCEGMLGNYDDALQLAARTLQLTQQLRYEAALPIDLYNLGFFHFASKKPAEALTFFRQAEQRAAALGPNHPMVKELYYFMGMAHLQTGTINEGKASLSRALDLSRASKDWNKAMSSLENLAAAEQRQGNINAAKKFLGDAVGLAEQLDLKDERRNLRKKLEALG